MEVYRGMESFVQIISSPAVVQTIHDVARDLTNPEQILINLGNNLEGRIGAHFASAFLEKIVRFGKRNLTAESPATTTIALERIGKLYDSLVTRIEELEKRGVHVTAADFSRVFEEPKAAAALTQATAAASETDDEATIGALSRLLSARLTAAPTSDQALRTAQAITAVRAGLHENELRVLGQISLVTCQIGLLGVDGRAADSQDQERIVAWYNKSVPLVAEPRANFMDIWELEARGLVVQGSDAASFDGKYPPHGSAVQRVWQGVGGSANLAYPSAAMNTIAQLEFGVGHNGERAFDIAALGAYRLTGSGYLLGIVYLQQLGIDVPARLGNAVAIG